MNRRLWIVLALFLGAPLAKAQDIYNPVTQLPAEAPETWAMRYFASASLFTAAGTTEPSSRGAIDFGLETIWVPSLDEEQRRVGFGGYKEEELNRAPVWARLRASFALGAGFKAELGYIPPVDIDGVKANLISLALGRQLLEKGPWSLAARLHLQRGKAKGDFTCKEGKDHLFPPGPQNPFGCEAPSNDEVTLDSTGLELAASVELGGGKNTLFGAVSLNRLETEFQVDAFTFGFHDLSRLENEGNTVTYSAGATWTLGGRRSLALEALYTPLDVKRPDQEKESDSLLHARIVFRVPLR